MQTVVTEDLTCAFEVLGLQGTNKNNDQNTKQASFTTCMYSKASLTVYAIDSNGKCAVVDALDVGIWLGARESGATVSDSDRISINHSLRHAINDSLFFEIRAWNVIDSIESWKEHAVAAVGGKNGSGKNQGERKLLGDCDHSTTTTSRLRSWRLMILVIVGSF